MRELWGRIRNIRERRSNATLTLSTFQSELFERFDTDQSHRCAQHVSQRRLSRCIGGRPAPSGKNFLKYRTKCIGPFGKGLRESINIASNLRLKRALVILSELRR